MDVVSHHADLTTNINDNNDGRWVVRGDRNLYYSENAIGVTVGTLVPIQL